LTAGRFLSGLGAGGAFFLWLGGARLNASCGVCVCVTLIARRWRRGELSKGPAKLQKFPMTAAGLQRLADELRNLKSVERPAIIVAIAEARSHGDLSENAEYHAARERQSFIEGRIEELEAVISAVEVIDPKQLTGDTVKFGAQVDLVDEETEKEASYQIVGVYEADIKQALLSISSPLAKALIGKKKGDTVSVPAPGGDRSYEILGIKYS
jgi:transcription elongation factor GreA